MDSLDCTVKAFGAGSALHCALPGSPWHDLLLVLGALVGAFIGGAAAILGQRYLVESQENLKAQEYERLDSGIRRQIKALVALLGAIIENGIVHRRIEPEELKMAVDRLNDRIYRWETSTAFTEAQSRPLYRLGQISEAVYRRISEGQFKASDAQVAALRICCNGFREFWSAMGEQEMAKHYSALRVDTSEGPSKISGGGEAKST